MSAPQMQVSTLPAQSGIGLRDPHVGHFLGSPPQIAWLEVHSENYFADGGPALQKLEAIRRNHSISLHGVGMSLGSADALDIEHLRHLKSLADRIEPSAVSEHLCWSSIGGRWLNDLLPLPYSIEALDKVCNHVEQVQDFLNRKILVENVSSYLRFLPEEMPEWVFVAEVARRTGCGILLDVNNIHVSAMNHGFDSMDFLNGIPVEAVGEIHLAGYEQMGSILVDTHSRAVYPEVWALYEAALDRFGPQPTLIEWDQDIPELVVLLAEAAKAQALINRIRETEHATAA